MTNSSFSDDFSKVITGAFLFAPKRGIYIEAVAGS